MIDTIHQRTRNFPKVHLVAVTACLFILGLTLLLLPSEQVSATRSSDLAHHATPAPMQHIKSPQPAGKPLKTDTSPEDKKLENTPSVIEQSWLEFTIGQGDTLSSLFKKAGLSARDVYLVAKAGEPSGAFKRLFPGQSIGFIIEDGQLIKLKHTRSKLESTLLTKTANGFEIDLVKRQPEVRQKFASGVISTSLFLAGEDAGLSNRKIMELASLFGWDVDFALDIRKGDSFNLIYEQNYLDGELINNGPIIAAQFINRGTVFTAIRYTDSDGNSSYYTPEGYSMRKTFLRSPVDFARISSRFNLRRKHPVLNKIRAHKGVDYAAGTGTPIKSSGDGKIIFRGKKGGYGKVVIVQHGGNITTLYAHMNNFKRGQRTGSRVKQGEVIGFVGKTGLASGPHLHYEFRLNGVHKNPLTVKLPQAAPIAKSERGAFRSQASSLLAQLETQRSIQLAANEQ